MKTLALLLLLSSSAAALAQETLPVPFPEDPAVSVNVTRRELVDKIVAQGVPRRGIERILEFQDRHLGAGFVVDVYTCAGARAEDFEKACGESARQYSTRTIKVIEHEYAVYIDFKVPSRFKRFWLINLKTGATELQLVAHGAGSAKGPEPQRFSNRKNSRMTSLGIYVSSGTYRSGRHGTVLRLHGLERSNSNAFNRDVVFHGAKYAQDGYLERINPKTQEPMDKIGESWGCPAVNDEFAQRVIPLLKDGAIFFHDHADLLDQAMSGEEVWLPGSEPTSPERVKSQLEKAQKPLRRSRNRR